jgi:RNA polymerase sigma-70 factor, ECF subfamily
MLSGPIQRTAPRVQRVDRRTVESAQRGDQAAFAEIAYALSPRLFAVAQRILRDHHRAEDVTQQALVLIWRKLPKLTDVDRFDAWAYRVLVNACYGELRRTRQERRGVQLLEVDLPREDDAITVDDRDILERAFERLSPEQRAVLVLAFHLGLDQTRIAEVLGIPLGTVKSRTSSARQAMRAALEAESRGDLGWRTA